MILIWIGAGTALGHHLTATDPHTHGGGWHHQVVATIDQPVRTYIRGHSQGLAVNATTVYRLWQLTGLITCVLGFATRRTGVQLSWVAWGAATAGMVWAATPGASRNLAVGITVFAWALGSGIALRGPRLRVRTRVHEVLVVERHFVLMGIVPWLSNRRQP